MMDFGDALRVMRDGGAVRRPGWLGLPSDTGRPYITLVHPADSRLETLIAVSYPGRDVIRPFAGTQWDLLALDWEIAELPEE